MLIETQRTELSYHILSILSESKNLKASELAERLGAAQRDIVGHLQSLKRRGMVTYERNGASPSAAGNWNITGKQKNVN